MIPNSPALPRGPSLDYSIIVHGLRQFRDRPGAMGSGMTTAEEIEQILTGMEALSPSGFAIGLHLQFTTSKYIFQNYDKAWMDEYSRRGLILSDPTVRWGVENVGHIRWSDLKAIDEGGVLDAAAEFGLTYGVSISVEDGPTRSLGSFASSKREFTDSEIEQLAIGLQRMHDLTQDVEADAATDRQLKKLAASMAHG